MKFTFIDGEKLGIYEDGKIRFETSAYIERYRETELRTTKNKEWKNRTDRMLADGYYPPDDEPTKTEIGSACPYIEENKMVYTFSVGDGSFAYIKYLEDEKKTEAHVLSSNDDKIGEISVSTEGQMLISLKKGYGGDIALLSERGDYKRVTGGDSLDENPSFTEDGDILFNSFAIGRDENNVFFDYCNSEIYLLKTGSLEIQTLLSDERYSYIKPKLKKDELYCIRVDKERNKKQNVFLSILMIPVRIVTAIVSFISLFVSIFTGKPLVEGGEKTRSGGGAAKNKKEGMKVSLNNYVINATEEMKRNQKDDKDYGFVPRGWKLVKTKFEKSEFFGAEQTGEVEELASGVADYVILEENGRTVIVYTNGKRIFKLVDGKKEKLCDTGFCVKLGALTKTTNSKDLFDRL